MIRNQPSPALRSLLAAAAFCAGLAPSAAASAEEPSAGRAPGGERPDAEPPMAAGAVPPTTSLSYTWIGSAQDSARLEIRFSQDVIGFTPAAVMLTCTHTHPTCAEAANASGDTGRRFFVTLRMPRDYSGYVIVGIPADVVVNGSAEGNIAAAPITIEVDTKGPSLVTAEVDGDELVLDFDEDLDERAVPSPGDFQVSYIRGSNFHVKAISGVSVFVREVVLLLESPVDTLDAVRLFYDNNGTGAIRDLVGNRAPGFVDATVLNVTGQTRTGVAEAPRDLTAQAEGTSAIKLAWVEPSDDGGRAITGYRIEVSEDAGDTWSTLIRNTRSTETQYRHDDLPPGATRHYRVSAINSSGAGPPSNVAHDTTRDLLPDPPGRLTARASGRTAIELSWRAPASSPSAPITGYRIQVSRSGTGGWITLEGDTESRATSYTHGNLRPGTTRHYRVAARNREGWSEWSNIAQATIQPVVPGAPTRLTVVPNGVPGTDQLLLTWSAPADDGGSEITGYRIETSPNGITSWLTLVANTGGTATAYVHTGLAPGSRRFYRVRAVNDRGVGAASNAVPGETNTAPPDPPKNLRGRAAGPSSVFLTWDPPESDGGSRITGYGIQRRGPGDRSWVSVQSTTGRTTITFTDTGLQPLSRYEYQVAAINERGRGQWSASAAFITHADKPGAPTGLTARAAGTSRIDLSWNEPRYVGGAGVRGYHIEVSEDGGENWRTLRRNTGSDAETFAHENLLPATTRHYRVAAINIAGNGPWSDVAHATTDAALPGVPGSLVAEAAGTSQINLSWRVPPDDGGAAVTGYRIEVSQDGGATWEDLAANTRTARTTYSHTGLEPASTRHYRVSAINRIGVGGASRVAGATTDATVPDAPTGLAATAIEPTRIDLVWIPPAYDGGAAVTGYRVEVSETGADWTDLAANTGSTATTYAHTGLIPGSRRYYRVSAINHAGTGAPSGVASAATDDPVERAGRLNTQVLPHVAAAMTSSTVSAIARRIDAVADGMGMERRVETGGLSSMAAGLSAPGAGGSGLAQNDDAGLAAIFGGTSFQMPFGASGTPQQTSAGGRLASWGAGEYQHLGEPNASTVAWSGGLVSAHAGVDARIGPDLLAGLAASRSTATFDFTDATGARAVAGTYGTTMTSVHPYMAWFSGNRGNAVWGSAGFGWGEVEVEDAREALRTSPARAFTGAAGGSHQLPGLGTGGRVRVRAEGWASRVMVDASERIDSVTLDMRRARLALEWTRGHRLSAGHEVAFALEGGMRYDNGAAANGAGAEVGGGLRYANTDVGLIAEGRGRFLVSGRKGYEEWGVGGVIQFDPAIRGQGLSIRLAPSWGDAASGVDRLWERGVSEAIRDHGLGAGATVNAEVSYGVAGFRGTPFGAFRMAERGLRTFSSGVRYDVGSGLGLRVEGMRREGAPGAPQHTIGVRGRLRFR